MEIDSWQGAIYRMSEATFFQDAEGTIPAKPGDPVALAVWPDGHTMHVSGARLGRDDDTGNVFLSLHAAVDREEGE